MLANFFGNSKPINFTILLIVFILLYTYSLYFGDIPFNWKTIPLFTILIINFTFINRKNNLTYENSFGLLFFVLFFSFFHKSIAVNNVFFCTLFLFFSFRKTYSLQKNNNILKKIFDAAFWLGIAFIFDPFSIIFILFLYSALIFFNKLNLRTITIPIIGFAIPQICLSSYLYFTDNTKNIKLFLTQLTDISINFNENQLITNTLLVIISLCIIAIIFKTPKTLNVINNFKLCWLSTIFNFFLSICLILTTNANNKALYIIFPSSIILANGFEIIQHKKISNIILAGYILSGIATLILNYY